MFQVQNVLKIQNGDTYGEQHITLNTILLLEENTCFQFSRDEDPDLAWSKPVSSQGGLL
jgi:hypothetical protein